MNAKIYKEIDWRLRVFESLSFPSLVMTPDKKIVTGNQVFLDKYNTTLEQIVGKTCHEVFYGVRQCPNENCALPEVIAERRGQSILRSVTTRVLPCNDHIHKAIKLVGKCRRIDSAWTSHAKAVIPDTEIENCAIVIGS